MLNYLGRVKRIWYLSPMRAAKVQASLRIRAVLPEPPLLTQTSRESRGTFRQKARSLAPLNGWACVVKICHEGMLEDTNSLDASHFMLKCSIKPTLTKKKPTLRTASLSMPTHGNLWKILLTSKPWEKICRLLQYDSQCYSTILSRFLYEMYWLQYDV